MKKVIILALSLLAGVLSAHAEWRVELFGGKFFPLCSNLTVRRPGPGDEVTCHSLPWSDRSFKSPIYYGCRIEKFLPGRPGNGFELEFVHAKIYSDPDSRSRVTGVISGRKVDQMSRLGDYIQRFEISHGLNFLLFNFVHRNSWGKGRHFSTGDFYTVFRAGLGPCICHTESIIEGRLKEQYEIGGVGFQIALGAGVPLKDRFYLPLEYKFSHARLRNLKVDHGTADLNLSGSHLTFGAGFNFSGP